MGNSKECVTALLGGARLRAGELGLGLRASSVEACARCVSGKAPTGARQGHALGDDGAVLQLMTGAGLQQSAEAWCEATRS